MGSNRLDGDVGAELYWIKSIYRHNAHWTRIQYDLSSFRRRIPANVLCRYMYRIH